MAAAMFHDDAGASKLAGARVGVAVPLHRASLRPARGLTGAAQRRKRPDALRASARANPMPTVTLIDNYDSFTFNLVHYPRRARRRRAASGATTSARSTRRSPTSPTPSCSRPAPARPTRPASASISCARRARLDADPRRLPRPSGDRPGVRRRGRARAGCRCTARSRRVTHNARGCFAASTARSRRRATTRLVIERASAPDELEITAETRRRPDHGGVASPRSTCMACSSTPRASPASTARTILAQFPRPGARLQRAAAPLRSSGTWNRSSRCIAKVAAGANSARAEAFAAFEAMLSGDVTPAQIGGFLMALRVRGESVEEITGAVAAMRAQDAARQGAAGRDRHRRHRRRRLRAPTMSRRSRRSSSPPAACPSPSTAIAPPRRNRAPPTRWARSASRSACAPEASSVASREAGIGFMMAPTHHAAMRHVGAARVELGTRTIFNLLGPLSNPAGVEAAVDRRVLRRLAGADGARCCAISAPSASGSCHGGDGLDEITTTAADRDRRTARRRDPRLRRSRPRTSACARAAPAELKGGDPAHNAAALREVLDGARNAYRDIAVFNAAGGAGRRGQGARSRRGRRARRPRRWTIGAARARRWRRLVKVSNA